jgi:hypothetical protein
MQLTRNGLTFSVDDTEVSRLVLERFNGIEARLISASFVPPRIGTIWFGQGGIYAGVARGGFDGRPDYYLIVGPEHDGTLKWDPAMQWAKDLLVEGFGDLVLPRRREQALLFANVPELFKEEAYWSCEAHASNSDYAWFQYFDDGYQDYWTKDNQIRARVVRRIPIH